MSPQQHEAKAQTVAAILERYRWNVSAAARHLGIDRANLYRLVRRYGLVRP